MPFSFDPELEDLLGGDRAEPGDDEPEPRPVNGNVYTGPIVGRATVAGMEEDD